MELHLPENITFKFNKSRCDNLLSSMQSLLDYCYDRQWAGWDPFDGLNSRLFEVTPLQQSPFARLCLIQALKRCPINLRGLLGVPEIENSKALALFASAAVRLESSGAIDCELSGDLIIRLLNLRSTGQKHLCWGYPFDWQNRHFMLPRGFPNIVCTVFGGHAILDRYEVTGDGALLEHARSITHFIMYCLHRTSNDTGICFSYTPLDQGQVHNANLLGAAFLARVWKHTGEDELKQDALAAAQYTIDKQKVDGAWVYGESPKQQWIDSFHTGYNLMALKELHGIFGYSWLEKSMDIGYSYYREHFFLADGIVRYYSNQTYPIDIHGIAHAIITLLAFRDHDPTALKMAFSILDWTDSNMHSKNGYYYYQKFRYWTNRIPYMRWGLAWMFLSMAHMVQALAETKQDIFPRKSLL